MANNLEIGIGSDISDLLKGIEQAEKEIKRLERQQEIMIRAGMDTTNLNRQIAESRTNLDRLRNSLNTTGQAASNMQRPVANAGNTLTNFSRIAQDAPFGIIGIGNNLTATAEAFGSLTQQAGGAGGALRALGSSLMGTGGILLAVSLVTTGLTLMAQKGMTVGDVFDNLTGNFDKYKNSLSEVSSEAAKNSAIEIQAVKNYVAVAQDRTLADNKRFIAVKKLQDEYPAYFGNLTKEKILNGNITSAVNEVTAAILAKARAQAASAKLGELAAQEFELEQKRAKLQEQVNKATAKTDDLLKQIERNPASEQLANRWARAGREAEGFRGDLRDIEKELGIVTAEMTKLGNASSKTFKQSIELETEKTPKPKKPKKPKKQPKAKIDRSFFFDMQEMSEEMARARDLIKPEDVISVDSTTKAISDALSKIRANSAALIEDFNKQTSSLLSGSISDAFSGIGEAIGSSLASGGNVLEALGQGLISSLGGILVELGKLAIATGVGILGIKTALKTLNPVAAIAAGVALVAIGSVVSSKSSALGDSIGKGGGISAGNSVSSPTSSTNFASSGGGFQNVVFEISGQSLVGVLSNTLNKNVKLGGTPAI